MELKSPQCPNTVTIRRNPPRRAKKTPATTTNSHPPPKFVTSSAISSAAEDVIPFSLEEDILQSEDPQNHIPISKPSTEDKSENIRVFLRIRPLDTKLSSKKNSHALKTGRSRLKGISPKEHKKKKIKNNEICLSVIDSRSVTLSPPQTMQDARRLKTEIYDGFSHVFESDSLQKEVYERVMDPLVSDFIMGKSGMLAAMGPTGSGKTHTVFGCPREPGMVPLALRKIFNCKGEDCSYELSRSYYISMFEIYSERGKGERIFDLSQDGVDLCMQQSTIKGLQEVLVSNVFEAEALIARGMLKRATAMTNSNSQSSRSQCIINIRAAPKFFDGNVEVLRNNAVLTIVDLAGAEKEKKTGNQGTRLLESNFINNTSMVFGLCLRSLLEHQKNPKKTFQKHFQNSLLTKYLRDYLEGKKRMTLILTVKPGEDDYLDTSFLLRQASPFMKIKFSSVEEPSNLPYQKRQISTLPRVEQHKRRKLSGVGTSEMDGKTKSARDEPPISEKDLISEHCQKLEPLNVSLSSPRPAKLEMSNSSCTEKCCNDLAGMERKEQIMQNFSKALWNVLKQYKKKFEESEIEVRTLQKKIKEENARYLKLEKELKDLKSCHSYCTGLSLDASFSIQAEECNPDTCSLNKDLKQKNYQGNTPLIHCVNENSKSFPQEENDAENLKDLKFLETMDSFSSAHTTAPVLGHSESLTSSSQSNILSGDDKCPSIEQKVVTIKEENDSEYLEDLKFSETRNHFSSAYIPAAGLEYSESLTSSSLSEISAGDDKCPQIEQKLGTIKETLSGSSVSLNEAVDFDACNARKCEPELCSPCKHSSLEKKKPRRKLLPASSILLKEINGLDLEVENVEPKGGRGGRKLVAEERKLSHGGVSLLRLLRSNRHLF